ncbi:MAG: hypothetical protein RIC49_12760 [Phycisphaerales bacterium]
MKQLGFLGVAAAVLLAGCAEVKEPAAPSAQLIAERLAVRKESPAKVQRWLVSRGFQPIERTGYGGVWPRTGPCYQTATGFLYRDKTVTRVCFAADRFPVVLLRETKGYYWTEVYPNDLSYNLYGPSGLGAISDETVEILKR